MRVGFCLKGMSLYTCLSPSLLVIIVIEVIELIMVIKVIKVIVVIRSVTCQSVTSLGPLIIRPLFGKVHNNLSANS